MRTLIFFLALGTAFGQSDFQWVNPMPEGALDSLRHETFYSKANKTDVGYVVLPPPGYDGPAQRDRRYPVIYYLHGGRPGSEMKTVRMAPIFDKAMREGGAPPMLWVFVNGGRLSHYDHEGSLGETAFVEELIPHIDAKYRTIARREGRGLQGFSQGGRGTARIMFKHPELFAVAAPMGGGHQHEQRIDQNEGVESEAVVIRPAWNNTWELARRYAQRQDAPKMDILVAVGTEDQNYEANLAWMEHLTKLGIDHQRVVADGVPHNAGLLYEKRGPELIDFFAKSFRKALGGDW